MFTESHPAKTLRQVFSQYCEPTDELIADIKRAARLRPVRKGQAVLKQGKKCDAFVINKRGLFRVSNVTNGKEDTVLFGTSGDIFTSMHSYFAGEPSIFSLVALEDSEVWLISYERWRRLEKRHPVLIRCMRDLLVEQLYGFEKRYLYFSNKLAEERFINFLTMQNASLRRTSVKYISAIVPLKYIAQYLNITQATLSRLRKRLVSNGSFSD